MPEPQRARNMDRAERKFDVMQQLGTELLLVCSNVSPASIDDDARATADLAEMAERADKRGLRVGFEALAWGRNINKWHHAWKIVNAADHPALGLIVDSFHTLAVGDDLSGLPEVPVGKDLFRPACRCSKAVDGRAVLEPSFPELPRPGPVAGCRLRRAT